MDGGKDVDRVAEKYWFVKLPFEDRQKRDGVDARCTGSSIHLQWQGREGHELPAVRMGCFAKMNDRHEGD